MSNAITNVADTAFWVAHYRAEESERADGLFRDGLARRLAGEEGRRIAAAMPTPEVTRWQLAVRTRVIDDLMLSLLAAGDIDTVLNLGAGLDTRPYRLELSPTLRWIEVDQTDVIALKTARLGGEQPRCRLERRAVDLADGPARRALLDDVCGSASSDRGRVLVLTEGVVPYLKNEDVAALADDLRARPAVVGWIAEYFAERALQARQRRMGKATQNAPFQFRPPEWWSFFAAHGWKPDQARYLFVEGEKLKRPFPAPLSLRVLLKISRFFIKKDEANEMMKMMGYILYRPG